MADSPSSSKENEAPRAAECSANAPASPPVGARRGSAGLACSPLGRGGRAAEGGRNPSRAPEGPPSADAPARPLGRKSAQRSLVFGGGDGGGGGGGGGGGDGGGGGVDQQVLSPSLPSLRTVRSRSVKRAPMRPPGNYAAPAAAAHKYQNPVRLQAACTDCPRQTSAVTACQG